MARHCRSNRIPGFGARAWMLWRRGRAGLSPSERRDVPIARTVVHDCLPPGWPPERSGHAHKIGAWTSLNGPKRH